MGLFAAGVLSLGGGLVLAVAAPAATAAGNAAVSPGPSAQLASGLPLSGEAQAPQGPVDLPQPEPTSTPSPEPTTTPVPVLLPATATSTPAPARPTPVPTSAPDPAPPAVAVVLAPLEQELFNLHSQERARAGVGSLKLDPTLEAVARQRAQDMASKSYFSHSSPSGETAFTIMAAYGFRYALAGENIARNNYPDPQSASTAMTGFMNSPSHRQNILEARYTYVGIGLAFGSDGMKYFAVVFAGK